MTEEEKVLHSLVDSVQYDANLFKIFIGEDKYIMGGASSNLDDDLSDFFVYQTIYDSIIDLDNKIKKSFNNAIKWEYRSDINNFNMVNTPTDEENEAIYYTENAVFRTVILWDLLAQLYNVKYKLHINPEKIYYYNIFHNGSQGKHPNPFADKVYSYLTEVEDNEYTYEKNEMWKGNHKYINDYRNKMTHRNSPNVVAISNYDIVLRPPMRYVLKRCIEDYVKASEFIRELLDLILFENEEDE